MHSMTLTFKFGNSDTVTPLQFRLKKTKKRKGKVTMYRNAVQLILEKK